MSFLHQYGFTQWFAQQVADNNLLTARVVSCHRQLTRLATEQGERNGKVSGRFAFTALNAEDYPCTGDWVLARDPGDGPLIIERLLERRSIIKRKAAGSGSEVQLIAANVDTVFVVQSCNQDLNARRLERYIAACRQDGVAVVIVFNKSDLLVGPLSPLPATWETPMLTVSASTGEGMEAFLPYLGVGMTAVFVGSSGVGKSTLINRLGRQVHQATQDIRSGDDRGRHTTTNRELFFANTGGMIIDTPGMREFGLAGTDVAESGLFDDIDALAATCRYRDCQHQGEPGCAVHEAIASGVLEEKRLASLRKLQREEAFQQRRHDAKSNYDTKKRWKAITKQMRNSPNKRKP